MFDRLIVSDGGIVNFVPRADRVSEVVGLVEQAIPDGVIHNVPTEHAGERREGLEKLGCKSGKGGICNPHETKAFLQGRCRVRTVRIVGSQYSFGGCLHRARWRWRLEKLIRLAGRGPWPSCRPRATLRGYARAAAIVLLAAPCIAACAPAAATSSNATSSSSATPGGSPSPTPNQNALEPNDCTAMPASATTVHSEVLGATMSLPTGWTEDSVLEGQQTPKAFAIVSAGGAIAITGELIPSTMSAHDAVDREAAYTPGSGTVIARGDCTVGGSKAAFFESSIAGFGSIGYVLYVAHGGNLVRLVITFTNESVAESIMPEVKSILGSWKWDQP